MNNQANDQGQQQPPRKGSPLMLIFAILVVALFVKYVFPAMEKGGKGPVSVIEEVNE